MTERCICNDFPHAWRLCGRVVHDNVPDVELPGMWESADFLGGSPDTVR